MGKIKGWKKTEDKSSNFQGWSKKESIGKYTIKYETYREENSKVGKIPYSSIRIIPQKTQKGFQENKYDVHLVTIYELVEFDNIWNRNFSFKTKEQATKFAIRYMKSHPRG